MNKICGYSCEHNKGGVCQITRCIKMPLFTTTTDKPLRQQISNFQKDNGVKTDENLLERKLYEAEILTRWQDPTIEEYKQLIKNWKEKYYQMKDERDKREEVLDKIKEKVNQYEFISGYYDDNYDGEDTTYSHDTLKEDILELLEEIE